MKKSGCEMSVNEPQTWSAGRQTNASENDKRDRKERGGEDGLAGMTRRCLHEGRGRKGTG